MSTVTEAIDSIPEYLYNTLKKNNTVLTPGEIFGAAKLWELLVKQAGGDPLEIISELQSEVVQLESQIDMLYERYP